MGYADVAGTALSVATLAANRLGDDPDHARNHSCVDGYDNGSGTTAPPGRMLGAGIVRKTGCASLAADGCGADRGIRSASRCGQAGDRRVRCKHQAPSGAARHTDAAIELRCFAPPARVGSIAALSALREEGDAEGPGRLIQRKATAGGSDGALVAWAIEVGIGAGWPIRANVGVEEPDRRGNRRSGRVAWRVGGRVNAARQRHGNEQNHPGHDWLRHRRLDYRFAGHDFLVMVRRGVDSDGTLARQGVPCLDRHVMFR